MQNLARNLIRKGSAYLIYALSPNINMSFQFLIYMHPFSYTLVLAMHALQGYFQQSIIDVYILEFSAEEKSY